MSLFQVCVLNVRNHSISILALNRAHRTDEMVEIYRLPNTNASRRARYHRPFVRRIQSMSARSTACRVCRYRSFRRLCSASSSYNLLIMSRLWRNGVILFIFAPQSSILLSIMRITRIEVIVFITYDLGQHLVAFESDCLSATYSITTSITIRNSIISPGIIAGLAVSSVTTVLTVICPIQAISVSNLPI